MKLNVFLFTILIVSLSCTNKGENKLNNNPNNENNTELTRNNSDLVSPHVDVTEDNTSYSDYVTITGIVNIRENNMEYLISSRAKKSYNLPETEHIEQNEGGLYKFVILSKDKKVLYTFNQDYAPRDKNCTDDMRCIKIHLLFARFKSSDDRFYLKLFYADKLVYESDLIKIIKCKADTSIKCHTNIRYGKGS